jgi:hypothetical protein
VRIRFAKNSWSLSRRQEQSDRNGVEGPRHSKIGDANTRVARLSQSRSLLSVISGSLRREIPAPPHFHTGSTPAVAKQRATDDVGTPFF